ncbi:hypothetical protein [Bradyrhizobium sp. STM 3562]|uniref:hypothetical protein n=1 Tax=Bradyrhizobium sp. STM 3562 TaxID=578924 RepID=UPI00388E76BB
MEDLAKLFEQHCRDDDRRREENVALLNANNDAIAALKKTLDDRLAIATPDRTFFGKKPLAAWPSSALP